MSAILAPAGRQVVISLAAGIGAAAAAIGLMVTAGYLISRAAARPPILDLALVFVGVRFFGLARPPLRYAERLAAHDATLRLLRETRRRICDALVPLAPARLLDWRSGDLLARIASDVDTLQDGFLRVAAPAVVTGAISAITAATLVVFEPMLAAIFVAAVVANGVVWPLWAERATRVAVERRRDEHAAISADLTTLIEGLDDVMAFGLEAAEQQRLAARQSALDAIDRRCGRHDAVQAAVGVAVTGLATGLVLVVLAWRVAAGAIDPVWVAALTLGVLASLEAADGLASAWRARDRVRAAAARIEDVVSADPAAPEPPAPEAWPAVAHAPAVRLDRVTFAYGQRLALDDVSLDVAAGEHVAVAGESGAGKSTLLGLICRFHDPQQGLVAIDGRDVKTGRLTDVRATLALVPQQVHVFDESLRENVRLLRPVASDGEVRGVLRAVGLEHLETSRAGGLDARLGEDGVRLSAGERQRLGVARALLSEARLLLVDEPAAHLDVETERDVFARLRAHACDRTLLVVSHRLSAVALCDRVVVMASGRIVAQGAHADLIASSDAYRARWSADARIVRAAG